MIVRILGYVDELFDDCFGAVCDTDEYWEIPYSSVRHFDQDAISKGSYFEIIIRPDHYQNCVIRFFRNTWSNIDIKIAKNNAAKMDIKWC